MRIAVSVIVLLTVFWAPSTASAQWGDPLTECERGVMEACWAIRFGRCAHHEPEIAIPACTRQLVNPNRMLDNSAFAALRRADHAQRYSLRATAYAKQGNFEQALEDYDRAIRAHGGLYWIHALRASALYATGSERGALDSLNDAIALAPDDPLLFNARARLLSSASNADVRDAMQAIADAQRASELVPDGANFVTALATVYAESGDFERAVESQQRAIGMLGPDDHDALALYRMRLALYEQGMPVERRFAFCSTDEVSSDSGPNNLGDVFSQYLVFCLDNRNPRD